MTATIRVQAKTLQELRMLKTDMGVRTYEEVIRILMEKTKMASRTHLDTLPELRTFKRDKVDRLG
jgi:hypothetical protein